MWFTFCTICIKIVKYTFISAYEREDPATGAKKTILCDKSKEAIKIEFVSENKNELIEQIINANKNLEQSNQSGDWEMIGKDMAKLQSLINQLETVNEQEKLQEEKTEKTENTDKNKSTNQNVLNRIGL